MNQLLQPRQKAIYFPEDCASGATIGYHCTILGLVTASSLLNPTRADLWIYGIALSNSGSYLEVPACYLFGTSEFASATKGKDTNLFGRICEMRFTGELLPDNDLIRGTVRLEGRDWERFLFEKWDLPYRSYELARPVYDGSTKGGNLTYHVPRSQILDRYFVLSALSRVFGVASLAQQADMG